MTIKTVLIKPRITEKAAHKQDEGVYLFQVADDATKSEIKKEIQRIYKVTVTNVNTTRTAAKTKRTRHGIGTKAGIKKAYVKLKDGDKINLV